MSPNLIGVFFFVFLLRSVIGLSDIWVNIDNELVNIRNKTQCQSRVFAGAECDCCLIQQTRVNRFPQKKAVEYCQTKQICLKPNKEWDNQTINILRPFEIININKELAYHNLHKINNINANTMRNLLAFLSEHGYLAHISSKVLNKDCFKISTLEDGVKGIHTGQLYEVSLKASCLYENAPNDKWHKLFILKESTKGLAELHNLFHVRNSVLENEYIATKDVLEKADIESSIIKIAFDELHFKIAVFTRDRYFSLLQRAAGKSFHKHLNEFGLNLKVLTSKQQRKSSIIGMKKIFYQTGFSISKLHQKYAFSTSDFQVTRLTYTHGDLHAQNVFFDTTSNRATLIDNETFALSKKNPRSGIEDLVDFYLLHTAKTVAHMFADQLWTNDEFQINDVLWHDLWKNLFTGYLDAFHFANATIYKMELNKFCQAFLNSLSNRHIFNSLNNLIDQRMLKRFGPTFRRNYLCKALLINIFEDMANEY